MARPDHAPVLARDGLDRPLIVGHRGVRRQPPTENTAAAFALAAAAGADWVELDVRRSADGVAVLHHEPRLPDGRAILTLTGDQLAERGVAHFDEVLAALPPALGVDVEVKNLP
ncbi:MAG: glycerophosphodiester phosphodiesterase, partial [Egibacteraceae bacterium]